MAAQVEISKRLVLINAASSVAARVLNVGLILWLYQYLLKRIHPDEFATYPVVMAVVALLPLLTSVLTGGLGRYIVEAYARGDEQRVTQIASTMSLLLLAAGLLVLAIGLTLAWFVDSVLRISPHQVSDARLMMVILTCLSAVRLPLLPFSFGLYVRQKFVIENILSVCTELIRMGVLFVLLFEVSTRVLWVVVASAGAESANVLATQIISRRLVPALRFSFSSVAWSRARELMGYGAWTLVSAVAEMIYRNCDVIILNRWATGLDVTCFDLGSKIANQIQGFMLLVSAPLQPALTALHAVGSADRLRSAYLRGGRYAMWILLAVSLPLMIYSHELVRLYLGTEFRRAATVMILILLAFPFGYCNVMLGKLAVATGQIAQVTRRTVFIQTFNLCLTLGLVGGLKLGAMGSALGTLVSIIVWYPLLMWPLGIQMAGTTWATWLRESVLLGSIPGLAAGGVWLGLRWMVRPETWVSLGFCAAAGSVVYGVVLLAFCLQSYERADFRRAWAAVAGGTNR